MATTVSPELLQHLLDEHGAALELFARQSSDTPEDCAQEAFLELVRQPCPPRNPPAWLFRVVRNKALSQRRSAVRRKKHEAAAAANAAWFVPAETPASDTAALTAALGTLSEEHREVTVARIWGGLAFEQIADVIGASTSSAHRRYEAGLRALREMLVGVKP